MGGERAYVYGIIFHNNNGKLYFRWNRTSICVYEYYNNNNNTVRFVHIYIWSKKYVRLLLRVVRTYIVYVIERSGRRCGVQFCIIEVREIVIPITRITSDNYLSW